MSEQKRSGKQRVILYVMAVLAIAAIVWIIFRGTNVFNYIDRANEIYEEQSTQVP